MYQHQHISHARALFKAIVLCCLANFSYAVCPQVSSETLLVHFCNNQLKCIDRVSLFGCVDPENILDDTTFLRIYPNPELHVLRRGFVHDLPELKIITAVYNNISRILPGAFLNLPKLDEVSLADSTIKEILWGVFNNMSISILDLSASFISYIENEAFSNMPNLKSLDLRWNRLKTYQRNWLVNSPNLERIILSQNQLERIPPEAFSSFTNLKHVDLSFNKIKQLDPWIFNNVKKLELLDLTSNKLWCVPNIFHHAEVDELKVSLNSLAYLDIELLDKIKVKSLMLHPNPWQCRCLEGIMEWMREHNTTLVDIKTDIRIRYHPNTPDCSVSVTNADKCIKVPADEFYRTQDIFFKAVNYTSWHYVIKTRFKPDCECA